MKLKFIFYYKTTTSLKIYEKEKKNHTNCDFFFKKMSAKLVRLFALVLN